MNPYTTGVPVMELKAVARIITYPRKREGAPQVPLQPQKLAETPPEAAGTDTAPGDFFDRLAEDGILREHLVNERKRLLAEVTVLRTENRWEDIVTLLHPVEEKCPELDDACMASPLRYEVSFALDHLGRFDEAIALARACVESEPENFHYHAGLAYTAYNSLYAAKTRRVTLHPAERKARIELAHRHFDKACTLRPGGVTSFYRRGMLFKQIQNKKDKALPLFETAVRNWDALEAEEREKRHQERKNFVKSLYQLASCLLDAGKPLEALEKLQRCIEEDSASQYLRMVHKHFALAKTYFHLGRLEPALDALRCAAALADPEDDDYVFELMARVHLFSKDTHRAWEAVNRVPPRKRRPYFRWTEADVLLARGETDRAVRILEEAAEKDRRGRHKALMRLVRIDFRRGNFEVCLKWARDARSFFWEQYQNTYAEALLWEAAALVRLKNLQEAARVAEELAATHPGHPHLGRLRQALAEAQSQSS
ncbi:MAG: tetratricopeptide repeat protein [Deltaproteobacteria bacterium]|nr:tetratricopeptide repeat protein [Deltaproteobacteria bacterium]